MLRVSLLQPVSPQASSSSAGPAGSAAQQASQPPRGATGATATNLQEGKRADAPPVFSYTRGSKRTALQIAADPALRAQAVKDLLGLVYADKSKGPRAEREATWQQVIQACGYTAGAEFTVAQFRDGTAVLKAAGYRTAFMIAEQALLQFLSEGGELSDALRRHRVDFRRACLRGLGPPKQSEPWPLELSPRLPAGEEALTSEGPLFPRRLTVCASWWLTREIEAGNAAVMDVQALDGAAAWALPASKTDISALGTARVHGCACGERATVAARLPRALCPACQLLDQQAFVLRRFGSRRDVPLWPTQAGAFPSKKAVVATIIEAAKVLGLRTTTPAGAESWGGHAFRRGGAQYLAKQGIDTWRIQALARHSSTAILKYLDEANLTSLRGLSTDAALGKSLDTVRAELAVLAAEARTSRAQVLTARQADSAAAAAVIVDPLVILPPDGPPAGTKEQFVVNTLPGGKAHVIHLSCGDMTYCRWQWKQSRHSLLAHSLDGFVPCVRCQTRRSAAQAQTADTSDSESSGESEPEAQVG